jgi:hypothetical protein
MDLARITRGEMVAGVSGALFLLVFFFAEWFGVPEGSDAFASSVPDLDGWASFGFPFDLVLFVGGAAAVAQALLRAVGLASGLPGRPEQVVAAGGALALLLVFLRLVFPPDLEVGGVEIPDTTREIGAFVALVASGGMTLGGYLALGERSPRR